MNFCDAVEGRLPIWRSKHSGRDDLRFARELLYSQRHMLIFINGLKSLNVFGTRNITISFTAVSLS